MKRRQTGERVAPRLIALLIALESLGSVPASGAPPPSWGLMSSRVDRARATNLWVRPLESGRDRALTSSGEVVVFDGILGKDKPTDGAVISPDGSQVAYVEHHPEFDGAVAGLRIDRSMVRTWDSLWVVGADGKHRRRVLELAKHHAFDGHLRSGSLVWSSDGKQIAYTIEQTDSSRLGDTSIFAVDVMTGSTASLFQARKFNSARLLGWSVERAQLSLLHLCDRAEFAPRACYAQINLDAGSVDEWDAENASVSPAQGGFAFIEGRPASGKSAIWSNSVRGPEWLMDVAAPVRGFVWLNTSSQGIFTAGLCEPGDPCSPGNCTKDPPEQALFLIDAAAGSMRRVRGDASELRVLQVAPDDSSCLVAIVDGKEPNAIIGTVWRQSLYVVPLALLLSEAPTEQLRRTGKRLRPAEDERFIGWVRQTNAEK